jgi:hypothetical protein
MNHIDLAGSVAQKILYQDQDMNDFLLRLHNLRINKKRQFDRLMGICSRLELIEVIKNSATYYLPNIINNRTNYQIERLTAYLATTCIDVLAGKNNYKQFDRWLTDEIYSGVLLPQFDTAINNLTAAPNTQEVVRRLSEETRILYEYYQSNYGIGRNFKRVITENPPWVLNWLANTYFIVENNNIIDYLAQLQNLPWLGYNTERRCSGIAKYLYGIRNRFTHTVDYYPPMENGGFLSLQINDETYSFNLFRRNGVVDERVEMSVGLRTGYLESEVIRFMVVHHLRTWLGLVDDQQFLDIYWERSQTRSKIIQTIKELEFNINVMRSWRFDHLYLLPHQLAGYLVQMLTNTQVGELIENRRIGNHPLIGVNLRQYNDCLSNLNEQISQFNENPEREDLNTFCDTIAQSNDARSLVYFISEGHRDLWQLLNHAHY